MAPVTPVIMRVLRPRCYRTSLAVYGIATAHHECGVFRRFGLQD